MRRTDGSTQCLIVTGNPKDGFTHIGPFKTTQAALEYSEDCFKHQTWWIIDLIKPAKILKIMAKAEDSMLPTTKQVSKSTEIEQDAYLVGITNRKSPYG
jgi:hypothetical protein